MTRCQQFYSHIFSCEECYAPIKRYCSTGTQLKIGYDAEFIAELNDPQRQRYWCQLIRKNRPEVSKEVEQLAVQISRRSD